MSDNEVLFGSDRAEDLTPDQVLAFFAGEGGDSEIVDRLLAPGTALLQGSRGTGKTMLLRVAHERLRRREESNVLPVFVSFSRYLAAYNSRSKFVKDYNPFQNWIFAKVLAALSESVAALRPDFSIPEGIFGDIPIKEYTDRLETHYSDETVADPVHNAHALGVPEDELLTFAQLDLIQGKIIAFLERTGFDSVHFFMDEAAQNFAEDLQPQFFQFIKHLRHYKIAVKAAVYPSTTNYGPDFDVGQDAMIIPLERQIETTDGMELFRELIRRRYTDTSLEGSLRQSQSQLDFLIKMSGGNPRWFIHLLSMMELKVNEPISSARAISAAKQLVDTTLWPYLQKLRHNMSSKRKYVDSAVQLVQVFADSLREANKFSRRDNFDRPVCYVAVSMHKTVPYRVHAALGLLQYAGIISDRGPKRITDRDLAEMYLLHPAFLLKEGAVYGGETNPTLESLVTAFTDPPREKFREFTRNSPRLLEFRQEERLDEIMCVQCGKSLPDTARFCLSCGHPVDTVSPLSELLACSSEQLELTPGIKQRVLADGRFPTIGSIYNADDEELDSIAWIGKGRVALIRYAVDEFLAG